MNAGDNDFIQEILAICIPYLITIKSKIRKVMTNTLKICKRQHILIQHCHLLTASNMVSNLLIIQFDLDVKFNILGFCISYNILLTFKKMRIISNDFFLIKMFCITKPSKIGSYKSFLNFMFNPIKYY